MTPLTELKVLKLTSSGAKDFKLIFRFNLLIFLTTQSESCLVFIDGE